MSIKLDSIHLFTDSEIVIAWVHTSPHLLKTFVANRVTQILELADGIQISHVRSELNPSDCATRGVAPNELQSHPLWWAGPPFLLQDPDSWGNSTLDTKELEIPELKKNPLTLLGSKEGEENVFQSLVAKYSSLSKLQRVMSYVLRFVHNCRNLEKRNGLLTVEELHKSMMTCVRICQQADFKGEILALAKNKQTSARLRKLNPFIDADNLLRVGGRLSRSDLTTNAKHPLLLSKGSPLARLIVDYYHRILLHAGPRTTRSIISRKYWILSAHDLIRKLIYRCSVCLRWQAKPMQPFMGELPSSRVQVSRCFAYTCLDMAGPFPTKETTRRKSPTHKSYFCIFVCEATKAVHLEAVSDLTTLGFLAGFDRFVSRRSLPLQLRSDNGKNFIGAKRELKECKTFLQDHTEEIFSALRSRSVAWKLNPSYASHMGGLFEAAVKSAKNLLYRQIGDTTLTFEEFATLLTKIEAVLNSRPLAFIPTDPNDGSDYLSPGHFMVGGTLVAPPEVILDQSTQPISRWARVKQLTQCFWRRWQNEYLHTLMQREKWITKIANIELGQLVYITNQQTAPLAWPIGRIVATYPGKDSVVRVVDVKTANGTYRRPVNKLIAIPPSESLS